MNSNSIYPQVTADFHLLLSNMIVKVIYMVYIQKSNNLYV